jgi:hypothetical protein
MRCAQVIDSAHHEHPLVQRQGLTGQRPAPARQRREAFPKRGVQPLNVGRIDHAVPLRAASERLHTCWRASDNAALGLDDTPPLIAFDHLGDQDVAPRTQAWSSPLARAYGIAKGLPNSPVIRNNIILSIQTIIWEVNLCRTGIT